MRNGLPAVDELGREAPPSLKLIGDDEAPHDREGFRLELIKQSSRNMVIAEKSPDLTKAIEAATKLYEVLYPSSPNEGYGGKLGGGADA